MWRLVNNQYNENDINKKSSSDTEEQNPHVLSLAKKIQESQDESLEESLIFFLMNFGDKINNNVQDVELFLREVFSGCNNT